MVRLVVWARLRVQIAKSFGLKVTAVCSTRNVAMARSLGADHVIDYKQEDFTKMGKRDLIPCRKRPSIDFRLSACP